MLDVRLLQADEFEDAVELSNRTFRESEQTSMAEAFPYVFSSSLRQSYGAFADGKLVSFVGLVPSIVRVGSARLNVYSVGSVCTDPDYRGRGYAGTVLNCILSHIDKAGASLLLVSGYGPLYTRMNCFRFGAVTRFIIEPDSAAVIARNAVVANGNLRELEPTDWFALAELARLREVGYEQSIWDLANLLQAQAIASCMKLHHKVLVVERQGKVEAFIVVAVPSHPNQKNQALAIEWAGNPYLIAGAFAQAVHRFQFEQLDVPVSWYETELVKVLTPAKSSRDQNLGTVHIVNPERFIRQLRPYLQAKHQQLSDGLQLQRLTDGRIEIRLNGWIDILDARSLVSLMFDPEPQVNSNPSLLSALRKLFPIPFPYAGGLNYV
jgi:predicted N-acetyltransferase YhbS